MANISPFGSGGLPKLRRAVGGANPHELGHRSKVPSSSLAPRSSSRVLPLSPFSGVTRREGTPPRHRRWTLAGDAPRSEESDGLGARLKRSRRSFAPPSHAWRAHPSGLEPAPHWSKEQWVEYGRSIAPPKRPLCLGEPWEEGGDSSRMLGLAPSLLPNHCWAELFPWHGEVMNLKDLRNLLVGRFKALKAEDPPNKLAWSFLIIEDCGEMWHVADPWFKPKTVKHVSLVAAANKITKFLKENPSAWTTQVGLTTAVVMGTIGDCEPTLDVVATNFFAAEMERVDEPSTKVEWAFEASEAGHGWCATDFFKVHDPLARAISDAHGSTKGRLSLSPRLWNLCMHLWGGEPVEEPDRYPRPPGAFDPEPSDAPELLKVPDRPVGKHHRIMPDDFVLVTHPDHIVKYREEGWETVPLPMGSREFIALGQAILEKGYRGLQEMKAMHDTLFEHIKAAMPVCEQSDLIYLVSGTTFHYFLASVFPEKQVFEVCPVPREDNGVCPEFYLGHYLKDFSLDPHFGFQVGRLYNKWLTAPKYLSGLEWSGEFRYREPPKYHAIPPWAADKWHISSPSVGFKPYGDFVKKSKYVEREFVSAYFSLGSCESLTPETQRALQWLKTLKVRWTVDVRWVALFEDTNHVVAPFFDHETGLAEFDWVVHHGGAGVTFTCCAIGMPQTILPQIGDQFIWDEALKKWQIPLHVGEDELRAQLYHERFAPEPADEWPPEILRGHSWWVNALTENGATPVRPYRQVNHCCHDFDAYGRKPSDLVVGVSDDWLFTLFVSEWDGGRRLDLKFVRRTCTNTGSRLIGNMGFPLTQTYPDHAHGWLSSAALVDSSLHVKAMPAFTVAVNDAAVISSYAARDLTSRGKSNRFLAVRPKNVHCACGGIGYDMGGVCERCALKAKPAGKLDPAQLGGYAQTLYGGLKPRLKPWSKTITFRKDPAYFAVQSRKRYYQVDSRIISSTKNPRVARALLDQIPDLSATVAVEAFWEYTKSKPPHYEWKSRDLDRFAAIDTQIERFETVSLELLGQAVLNALASVLSVRSFKSVWDRLNLQLLTAAGRDFSRKRWWVVLDGLRHFSELAKRFGIDAMPEIADRYFPPIPEATVKAVIPYKYAIATALRTRAGSSRWLEELRSSAAPIKIHLFALRLPALGTTFGVFHAVVEHDGWFWELQQTSGELCHINRTKWAPEASPDRPLVKSVLVTSEVVGSLDVRRLCRDLERMEYKVLGENCLVFANLLTFLLTGKVVPWRHFGAFGRDFPLTPQRELLDWASSFFFLADDEERIQVKDGRSTNLEFAPGGTVRAWKTWVGPKTFVRDYGLRAVQRVEAALEAWSDDPDVECPQERDHMLSFIEFAMSNYRLTGAIVARAVLTRRIRRIPTSVRKWRFLQHLLVLFRQLKDTRIVADALGVITATSNLRGALRTGKKVGWTPILNISVPRHWFRSGERLVEVQHLPENLNMQPKQITRLDLPQIRQRYAHYFEGVEMPKVGFRWVKPGEYEIGVKVPIRTKLPEMDKFSAALIRELQEMHPFELGVFSLRFGTTEMAEKVTDRYFTGSFAEGELIPVKDQEEIAQAIFDNENHLYRDTQLISPEEVWKKWHRNYSAGFPFRFNEKGRASRQDLIDAVGGKAAFLAAVRRYIESPEAFPTVSHAFIKDEVLPRSYVEREKIRTIIAQDPLNYFLSMAVQGDASKRLDPTSFSAVGVSASHGEMVALAGQHLAYKHHTAMDVTAMDSTAALDAVGVLKKLRKLGFQHHPQREAVCSAVDATYDNLVASWIIDIHTGRARLKKQGLSTGHASTTPANTEYMRVLMLYAWKEITGRPYKDFYECVKFSSFSDDNYWSTNLDPTVFSGDKVSEFWLSRGVQVRVEGASDDLSNLSFLSKKFSFDPVHLAEVEQLTGVRTKVAVVHDVSRLLQKFSDYKKKNTIRYRWEKFAALQLNCAHLPEVHAKVGEYLDVMEKTIARRESGRRFLRQHPRKTYEEVMRMAYVPGKHQHDGLVVSTFNTPEIWDKLVDWWDTVRADVMTFDSTANSLGRIASQFTGLLEIGGLNIEDPGLFMKGPGELHHDDEYTLEHHLYLLSGCPESFEKLQVLASKSPFSMFMDLPGFWARREYFDVSEEMANGLRVKVCLLLMVYTMVAWLEQSLMAVPIIGPMYRLLATAKNLSERVYSRLNSVYYAVFGDSSSVISSMMPKDRYLSLKVIAHRIWCIFTPSDVYNFPGGIENFQEWVDAAIKFGQDIHQISLDFDISPFLPVPGTGERGKEGVKQTWDALDHSDSVGEVVTLLKDEKVPLITGPTGAGKSTDFIVSLHKEYETVIVACPRVSIVQANPVAQTKLFAGTQDSVTRGYINFGTAGYLRRVLADLPPSTVVVLDEFHELDEDTLWLLDRYRGQVVAVTATPEFYGAERFKEVKLTKSRVGQYVVKTELLQGKATLEEAWDKCCTFYKTQEKVLVILKSVSDVEQCLRHSAQLAPNKRVCGLYRGHSEVKEADWYFATSIVDAGITIPGVTVVVDTGWSLGWKEGKFQTRPSSHNVSAQRRGRTGRTCSGLYVRLHGKYDDTGWDFSTPFLANCPDVAKKWAPGFKRGRPKKPGELESIPSGHEEFFARSDWSAVLYTVFLYETRLDVNKARATYQACRKFPEARAFRHLTSRIENFALDDLYQVEARLQNSRLPDEAGNFWNWDVTSSVLVDFSIPVPRHLADFDL